MLCAVGCAGRCRRQRDDTVRRHLSEAVDEGRLAFARGGDESTRDDDPTLRQASERRHRPQEWHGSERSRLMGRQRRVLAEQGQDVVVGAALEQHITDLGSAGDAQPHAFRIDGLWLGGSSLLRSRWSTGRYPRPTEDAGCTLTDECRAGSAWHMDIIPYIVVMATSSGAVWQYARTRRPDVWIGRASSEAPRCSGDRRRPGTVGSS